MERQHIKDKFLGLKKAGDVKAGMRVRTRRDLQNSYAAIPNGSVGVIEFDHNMDGHIHVKFDPCNCCGMAARISGLYWRDLELVDFEGVCNEIYNNR